MIQHVGEFMSTSGALLPFTQQGLEKYNDMMTKDYFCSSSHKGQECLTQILQKQNGHLENTKLCVRVNGFSSLPIVKVALAIITLSTSVLFSLF